MSIAVPRGVAFAICTALAVFGPALAQDSPPGSGDQSFDRFFKAVDEQRERVAKEQSERADKLRQQRQTIPSAPNRSSPR